MSQRRPRRPSIWPWEAEDMTFLDSLLTLSHFLMGLPQVYKFTIEYYNTKLKVLQKICKLHFYRSTIQNHIESCGCYKTVTRVHKRKRWQFILNIRNLKRLIKRNNYKKHSLISFYKFNFTRCALPVEFIRVGLTETFAR